MNADGNVKVESRTGTSVSCLLLSNLWKNTGTFVQVRRQRSRAQDFSCPSSSVVLHPVSSLVITPPQSCSTLEYPTAVSGYLVPVPHLLPSSPPILYMNSSMLVRDDAAGMPWAAARVGSFVFVVRFSAVFRCVPLFVPLFSVVPFLGLAGFPSLSRGRRTEQTQHPGKKKPGYKK